MAESDEQQIEALRLLNIYEVSDRGIHRWTGVDRKTIAKCRAKKRPMSKRMAEKIIAGYWKLSDELRPKVKRNETDQEP